MRTDRVLYVFVWKGTIVTRLAFNNVKPKEQYFVLDSIQDRIRMCKTNHIGLPHDLDLAAPPVIIHTGFLIV